MDTMTRRKAATLVIADLDRKAVRVDEETPIGNNMGNKEQSWSPLY
jgi:hypothetical protein